MLAATPLTGSNAASSALHTTHYGSSGPRIVFLHGLFGQGKNWTSVAKFLSDSCRITLVDLPDHGRSAWTQHVSYPGMATAVADLLTVQFDGEPAVVVGHSLGGKVAMALALLRPELVGRLCVVDIAPVNYAGLGNFGDYVRGMRSLELDRLTDRAAADRFLAEAVPDATVRSFLLQNLRREGTGWRWQMNLQLLGEHLDDLAEWPDLRRPPYPGPTLWIAGADSDYVTGEQTAAMRALFPRVRLLTVKRAGHWVHADQPEVFVAAVREFVSR